MDPWLEDYWGDVHASLTAYARDRLQPTLPSGLKARIEEYVTVESKFDDEEWRHHFVPDVMVTEQFRLSTSGASPPLGSTVQLNGADDGVEFIGDSDGAVGERSPTDPSATEHFVELFLIGGVIGDCRVGVL
jgi:Protein of unknown function (DUF4058)